MNGRLEVDKKIFESVEKKIKNMPQFIIDWYYNLRASEVSASSCRDYVTKLNNYIQYICNGKDISLDCFSNENIARYLTHIQTKKVNNNGEISEVKTSDSYRQGVWSCLNNFCTYLYQSGLTQENAIRSIKRPKNNDLERINKSRILLTENDFNNILQNMFEQSENLSRSQLKIRNRDLLILLMFMTTGMRKTALSEINVSDINIDGRTLEVIDKREKIHTYIISDKTYSALAKWLCDRESIRGSQKTDALFVSQYGRLSGNEIYNIVNKRCNEALGYNISPHKIRAGFCSVIYDKTKDIEFTRRTVGHSNIETTKRYIVTKNDERNKSSKIMDNLLSF